MAVETKHPQKRLVSRRHLLSTAGKAGGGIIALAAAGYAGYRWPHAAKPAPTPTATPNSASSAANVDTFVSRPDLSPPHVTITHGPRAFAAGSGAPSYIFVAPRGYTTNGPGQAGPMILDTEGRLVWFQHVTQFPMNLQVQRYQGKPVLTWWEGTILNGYGEGNGVIYDSSYRQIATVKAGNGLQVDLHEFLLTPQDTALITAYHPTTADLSPVGGSQQGQVLDCVAQEVDVASGKVLFEWRSLDHVGVDETYDTLPSSGPFDYFHINSIAVAPDGNLIISARNTWTVYKISRQNGQILWRLGGKRSDFTMGSGARFFWQHDARPQGANQITLFDDGASPAEEKESRGIVLSLDSNAKTASLARQYTHPAHLLAANQGSMQVLSDGRVFIGWGAQPYFTEFSADGRPLLDGRFPADDQSYRAFTFDWSGHPADPPAVAVGPNGAGGATVYTSWNGATQFVRWRVLAGTTADNMQPVATSPHTSFETAITVDTMGPYFAVVAFDRSGQELARSQVIKATLPTSG